MRRKTALILGIIVFLVFVSAKAIFSQEPPIQQPGQSPSMPNAPEMQWIYGEVLNIDAQNKVISVKYLDYETDQEKEIAINIDEQTVYENIKSMEEIKPKDAVSVDYTVSPEGKNIAKKISLEKAEVLPALNVPATEITPGNLQPDAAGE